MEPMETRLIWLTMIACMDEDGFVQFAGIGNLAHRAVIPIEQAKDAVKCLESPDLESSDPDHEGRRIERVPGGWMVLNAPKYREIVTRLVAKEGNRRRVARHREKEAIKKAKKVKPKLDKIITNPLTPRYQPHKIDCGCIDCAVSPTPEQ